MTEFEISEEFATANALTPEQIEAVKSNVTEFYTSALKAAETTWEGKANENAQGIIDGAITATQKAFKVELPKNQGEKHADYMIRLNSHILSSKQAEIEKLETDLKAKLENFNGDAVTREELEKAQNALREAQTKYVDYDELSEKAGTVETLTEENARLTKRVTFGAVKPNFPDTVDPRIIQVEWKAFQDEIEKEWDVKLVEDVPTAINKENPMKTAKLSDLLAKNEEIQKLLEGRQQTGTGANPKDLKEVEGVPFKIPVNATGAEKEKLITEHLTGKGLGFTSKEFSVEFGKLYNLISKQQNAAK